MTGNRAAGMSTRRVPGN
jgi:hypothetical protein